MFVGELFLVWILLPRAWRWSDFIFNIIQKSSRSSPQLKFLNIWLQVHIQIIFMKEVLFFHTSCVNWKYCTLGSTKFLPYLLMFFQQHFITGRNIQNGSFSDSLFLHNCANTISKQGQRLWRYLFVKFLAIHES